MDAKQKCMQKARELAVEYQSTLVGCAHCSFAAAVDALRMFGKELVSEEIEDEIFKSLIGLTGGVGNMNIGTCGAVTGSSAAVSLATGIGEDELKKDGKKQRWISYYNVKTGIVNKFYEAYGSIICRDILIKRFGMAFNSRYPGRNKELFEVASKANCLHADSCVIANGAAWAVERIWDFLEKQEDLSWVVEKHEPEIDK